MNETSAVEYLNRRGINYTTMEYPENGPVAAAEVAEYFGFGAEAGRLFKTLVTTDHKGGHYVFCIPATGRLDIKKAAALVGVKNLQMVSPEHFQELTGYTHGGCSPIGMKTELPTFVDHSALQWNTIYLSGGKVGLLIEIAPDILGKHLNAHFEDITKA